VQVLISVILAVSVSQTSALATGGIAGRITADGTNAPIAGAHVMLLPLRRPAGTIPFGPPSQSTTDQDGRFTFDRVEPGDYRLNVQKGGFAPNYEPMTQPTPVTVVAGQQTTVEFHLKRGGVISGRVLDPKGEPLTDVRVMALRRIPIGRNGGGQNRLVPAPMTGPQQTNDLGEFRISGLAPGEYVVAVVPHGFTGFGGPGVAPTAGHTTTVTTFYPGTVDQTAAQLVSVAAGGEVGNVVFTVQSTPGFRVSGIIVDENAVPLADAMVSLVADPRSAGFSFGPVGGTRSDANGRFVIDDVPAGTYRANASVIMRISGTTGGGVGAVSGGWVSSSVVPAPAVQPPEIVVTDSDVKGVRIVATRPIQQ
jgi:carboxypeptidase family protein